jgi:hypothetical protein
MCGEDAKEASRGNDPNALKKLREVTYVPGHHIFCASFQSAL